MIKILKKLRLIDYIGFVIVLILVLLQVYFDLSLPDYVSQVTQELQTGGEVSAVLDSGIKMLAFAFGSMALSIIVAVIVARIAANMSYRLRGTVFNKVMGFSMSDINHFSIPSLITRTTNDINQVQLFIVMGLQMLIKAPITAIWAITKIYSKNIEWTYMTAIAVIVIFLVIFIILSLSIPRFKKIQFLTDNINRVTRENLDGLNVVRAYNAETYQEKKFENANKELTDTNLFVSKAMSFFFPTMMSVSNILVLAIYVSGAYFIMDAISIQDKGMLFGDMLVFSSYAMQVIFSFMMLVMVFMILPRASVSAKRINEILDKENAIVEGSETSGLEGKIGEVEFKNVCFKYSDADDYVLKDINFTAKQGEVVAFIGATGCGKSTIVNLVPRFYDVTVGEIIVNGRNVKEYSKEALNKMISYVSQKSTIFTGSVKSNILFGDNAEIIEKSNNETSEETLISSIETAQAKEFVDNLENKYDSYVAQGGKNLSGGQKQRLSIARAIYRNAEIFIFDDSFSALDYKTDQKLRHALNEECKGTTRLIVGQRIGTIKDADKIIVLENGSIVGEGKHKDLLTTCDVYKQIALSQLSEEELTNA